MLLNEVHDYSEFGKFYAANNLETTQSRIDYLIEVMGILCIRHDNPNATPEEELMTLEQHALQGWDGHIHCTSGDSHE